MRSTTRSGVGGGPVGLLGGLVLSDAAHALADAVTDSVPDNPVQDDMPTTKGMNVLAMAAWSMG